VSHFIFSSNSKANSDPDNYRKARSSHCSSTWFSVFASERKYIVWFSWKIWY